MSIDLSLDRIQRLYRLLPPYTRPTIHIAGTNGKGSVSALVSYILISAGLSVGRFNSPHLISVHDCITLNNQAVSQETYRAARDLVARVASDNALDISSFEILTLTALVLFENAQVDVVAMEVGMGGRLDATNVIPDEVVLVSALTSVDLDHQAFLGDTIAAITREKASIARRDRPFVLGPQIHPEVLDIARTVVAELGGNFLQASSAVTRGWHIPTDGPGPSHSLSSSSFQPPRPHPIKLSMPCFSTPVKASLPLHGTHQLDNVGLAASIISAALTRSHSPSSPHPSSHPSSSSSLSHYGYQLAVRLQSQLQELITPAVVAQGIANVSWPGRLSFHTCPVSIPREPDSTEANSVAEADAEPEPEDSQKEKEMLVLVDGAHNPASAVTLNRFVKEFCENTLLDSKPKPKPTSLISTLHGRPHKDKHKKLSLTLTYILSLSHSPPKTPMQTLSALLPPTLVLCPPSSDDDDDSDIGLDLRLRIALLRFSPPDGMPWVKPVPPSVLGDVVREICPGAEVWVGGDGDGGGTDEKTKTELEDLRAALAWAALGAENRLGGEDGSKEEDEEDDDAEENPDSHLVILAGSLYLVADFYRVLRSVDRVE